MWAELEHGDRSRRDHNPLEQVEVHTAVMGDRRLDGIGVRHHDNDLTDMIGHNGFECGDHPSLHLANRLSTRKSRTRRRTLHDLPKIRLRQLGNCATRPLAIVRLEHAWQRPNREAMVRSDRRSSLTRPFDRTRVHRADWQRRQALARVRCLLPALIGKVDSRSPA